MTEFPLGLHFSLYKFPFIACSHGMCVKTETFSGLTTIFKNLELSSSMRQCGDEDRRWCWPRM